MNREERLAYTLKRHDNVSRADSLLRQARDLLRECDADNSADYVARAIKSTEGALRHAKRLVNEAQAEPTP